MKCAHCLVEKSDVEFGRRSNSPSGKHSWCKNCVSEASRKYRSSEKGRASARESLAAYISTPHARFLRLKRDAKRRGLEVTITEDEFIECYNSPCVFCGRTDRSKGGYGLDRIRNDKGYHIDNIVPSCHLDNMTRGDRFTFDEYYLVLAPVIRFILKRRESGEPFVLPRPI